MNNKFSHPPLFIGFLKLYKEYYRMHQHLPKLFRVTLGEHILSEMAEAMKLIAMANFNKKHNKQTEETNKFILTLRGKIELLKIYFLIGWETKAFSDGFYAVVNERLEDISKQAYAWGEWFYKQQQTKNKGTLPDGNTMGT